MEKAREEGQIAASKELTAAAQFALAVGLLWMFGGEVAASLRAAAHGVIRAAFRPVLGMPELEDLGMALASDSLTFLWTFGASLLTVGLLFHMAQTQFALTTKRLTPDIKRLNPMQKLKELPVENLTQTLKAVLLLPLVGGVFYYVVSSDGSSPRQRAEFRRQLPEFASVMGWIGRSASVYRLLVRQRNPQRIEDFCLAGVGNRQPCDAGLLIHSIFQ